MPAVTQTANNVFTAVKQIVIHKCKEKALLFPTKKVKNRLFKPHEMETEKDLCKIFHRPPRTYYYDAPFYPWLPPEPKVPKVNFDLHYTE